MRWLRLLIILWVALKYGLDEFLLGHERIRWLRPAARVATFWRDLSTARAARLRLALEDLGPIFVKFGQVLSTRRDLLPLDVADELALLQDRVPPFPGGQAVTLIEQALRRRIDEVFSHFDEQPVASASIAQVHFGVLKNGREVAVKVL